MNKIIEVIKACRSKWLSMLDQLTVDQLNAIPPGFNNNLAWQLGHVIVSQQILCYRLAGQKFVINEDLIDRYKNGSRPESYINKEEISLLKDSMLSTIDQLEMDLKNGLFVNYTPYTISTYAGFTLSNLNDALVFIVSHDALHYGCSISLKKLV
ncbi:DinB family protein [Pedobacter insulae]|uniref:DinB superfamily protein n=1 Tax=Pedobacter insulae TaxID=414048 RepID=A0A1I2UB56_9SPHI|nr:DinB family protein [Pedobacter insulae]SFG74243.1 DinB superfamily protein [Pedobacter insulae]